MAANRAANRILVVMAIDRSRQNRPCIRVLFTTMREMGRPVKACERKVLRIYVVCAAGPYTMLESRQFGHIFEEELSHAVFDLASADSLLASGFAPWVLDLGLSVEQVNDQAATLRMAYSDRLCRQGEIICGQAIMALADTAAVFAVLAASGRNRPLTTVDQSCHFLKPALRSIIWRRRR